MKVIVIGAGVVGTTSAWYLSKAGHEVTVIDRRDGVGLETSFANGGQISPSHAEPWAHPAVLPKVLKWLGRRDAPLLFHWLKGDASLFGWALRFLVNCTPGRAEANTARTLRVALYSRACLQALRQETGIAYDQKTAGILHVYRDQRAFAHACRAAELMRSHGLDRRPLDMSGAIAIEPVLAAAEGPLAGGIYTPGDESGDAHKFTRALADLAAHQGVAFRFGTAVLALETEKGRVTGLVTDKGRITADAFVLAAATESPRLARPLGLTIPIVAAKGYSLTVPVAGRNGAPTVSITDDEHKMVYSRLGDRLRCAGTAELGGVGLELTESRLKMIEHHARALFPDGGDYARATPWCGLRPVTPDSVPILGSTPFGNLFLDTGHGTLGWTMACGSGRILADLVSGRVPEVDMEGLGLDRFG